MINAVEVSSTRPYLIRAIYEWCSDNGLTPYVAVAVDGSVQVPREFVKDNEIVLNVSLDATSSLKLGNEFIEFKARFAGTPREIMVPIGRVTAIYAKESGQGMSFPLSVSKAIFSVDSPVENLQIEVDRSDAKHSNSRPATLTSVKKVAPPNDGGDKPSGPATTKTGAKLKRVK